MSHDTPHHDIDEATKDYIDEAIERRIEAQQTLPDQLIGMGLSRRQALVAAGYIAAGMAIGPAILKVFADPVLADTGSGSIGTSDNPLKAIYVDELYQNEDYITAIEVDTDTLLATTIESPDLDAKADDPHDNAAHDAAFIADGDNIDRQHWVIAAGADDPAGADPEDIIFEEAE